jgi:hypothetical protein
MPDALHRFSSEGVLQSEPGIYTIFRIAKHGMRGPLGCFWVQWIACKLLILVRPDRFELPTFWS